MEKICLERLNDVSALIEFNMTSEAAEQLTAFHTCAERSDCSYWHSCAHRVEDLWNRQMYAAQPDKRRPS